MLHHVRGRKRPKKLADTTRYSLVVNQKLTNMVSVSPLTGSMHIPFYLSVETRGLELTYALGYKHFIEVLKSFLRSLKNMMYCFKKCGLGTWFFSSFLSW